MLGLTNTPNLSLPRHIGKMTVFSQDSVHLRSLPLYYDIAQILFTKRQSHLVVNKINKYNLLPVAINTIHTGFYVSVLYSLVVPVTKQERIQGYEFVVKQLSNYFN